MYWLIFTSTRLCMHLRAHTQAEVCAKHGEKGSREHTNSNTHLKSFN